MFSQQFYYSTIKNYIGAFGVLFSDISIQRQTSSGTAISGQNIKVPVSFGQKRKFYQRLIADPNAGDVTDDNKQRQVQIVLPAMSIEIGTPVYDNERKLNSIQRIYAVNSSDGNKLNVQYVPVPYNFPFTLSIATKAIEDLFQIIEQILPYFNPEFTVTIKESDVSMAVERDISILLENGSFVDQQTQSFTPDPGYILYELSFLLRGSMYGQITKPSVITTAQISLICTSFGFTDETPPNLAPIIGTNVPENSKIVATYVVNPEGATANSDWSVVETIVDETQGE